VYWWGIEEDEEIARYTWEEGEEEGDGEEVLQRKVRVAETTGLGWVQCRRDLLASWIRV